MRHVKNLLLVLFTLALAAAGAAMPFAASRLQDARQAGAEVRSFDSFVLTLEKKSEFSKLLRFLSEKDHSYAFIGAAKGVSKKHPSMSEDEALEMAREAVALLAQYGIVSQDQMKHALDDNAGEADQPDVQALVTFSETDRQDSYIVWNVEWLNVNIGIRLDDASGKAYFIDVADFWVYAGEKFDSNAAHTGVSNEFFYERLENWCRFVEEYYDVSLQDIEEAPEPNPFSRCFLLYIDLEDGGDWLPLLLYVRENGAGLSPSVD